jgi:hypothetical protein
MSDFCETAQSQKTVADEIQMSIEQACEAERILLLLCDLVGAKPVRLVIQQTVRRTAQSRSKATDEAYREFFIGPEEKKDQKRQRFLFTCRDTNRKNWVRISLSYFINPNLPPLSTEVNFLISFATGSSKQCRGIGKAQC